MNLINKRFLTTALGLVVVCAAFSTASAQTALFTYDDNGAGGGLANSGTYHPGDSFTFSIRLSFTPGGTVSNLDGVSYWFQQKNPAGAPFPFSITLRDVSTSTFNDLQTPGLTYPQNLNPSTASDLGGALQPGPADGAGTYLIANLTMQISPTAPITGTYTLSQTLSGGKISVISDSAGHTFAIPEADYTVTLVPEPGTWAAAALALLGTLTIARRRFIRARQTA